MVSSLLNKLANYTNLTQGVREHEEAEDGVPRVTVTVNKLFGINYLLLFFCRVQALPIWSLHFHFTLLWNLNYLDIILQGHQINEGMTGVTTAGENDAKVHVQLSPHDCMRGMRNVVLQVDDVLCAFGGIQ